MLPLIWYQKDHGPGTMLCMKLHTFVPTWHPSCNHVLVFQKQQLQAAPTMLVAKEDLRVHGLAPIRKGKGNKENPKANPTEFNGSQRPWSRARSANCACDSRRGNAHWQINANFFMDAHIPQLMEPVANHMELKFMNAHHTDS